MISMVREYLPKLAIAILVVSVALILLSAQPAQVSALRNPQNSTDYHWHHYWWGGGGGSYWGGGYYWGYPYYYYYYPYYSYYYSSSYCPSNSYYSSYPYYYSSYYSSYYCAPSSYTLTVATDPSSLGTVTGGGSYTSGSSASFSVTQPTVQVSSNTRYVFDHWSGGYTGSATSGSVTMNNAMTITAEYQLQYYLTVNSQPQSAPTPQGSGWYNAGSTVTLQNAGQTIGGSNGSQLVFQGWSVDGQSPQTSSSLNVVADAPHTVTAQYAQQYYLNVQSDQGVTSGSGWYNAGSTAQISVTTPVSTQYGISIIFNGWQGDIQSPNQSTSVLVNGPMNVIATWRTDSTVLYLTIGAIIVAAVLIVAGIFAFMAKGRGGTQAPQPYQPTTSPPIPPSTQNSNTQPNQPAAEHRTRHYRKKTVPTDTENTQPTPPPS